MTTRDPYSDAYSVRVPFPEPPTPPLTPEVPWPDGRIYLHTDGVVCGAGQNQVSARYEGGQLLPFGEMAPVVEVLVCRTHGEDLILAARYVHEDDDSDCDADEGQVLTWSVGLICTLHETHVRKVW